MNIARLEPWLPLQELAKHLDMSPRWLEYRVAEGMPSTLMGTRRKFKATEVEKWLEREGHLVRSAAA